MNGRGFMAVFSGIAAFLPWKWTRNHKEIAREQEPWSVYRKIPEPGGGVAYSWTRKLTRWETRLLEEDPLAPFREPNKAGRG